MSPRKARRRGRAAGPSPASVNVRMYNVGFGDCFLLTFAYKGGDERQVLMDFGTLARPTDCPDEWLKDIATDIQGLCDGKRTAVVFTHRHSDHMGGFAGSGGPNSTWSVLKKLRPELVLQPWTEDPERPSDAKELMLRERSGYLQNLNAISGMGKDLEELSKRLRESGGESRLLGDEVHLYALKSLDMDSARKNIEGLADKRNYRYLGYEDDAGLGAFLPGVKVSVLGPPTLSQLDAVRKKGTKTDDIWLYNRYLLSTLADSVKASASPVPLGPGVPAGAGERSFDARWFIEQMDRVNNDQLHAMVELQDNVVNNTSLILLFEFGGHRLLFPGDAELEDWGHVLNEGKYDESLAMVDVYKVGHHGSKNATPGRLWNLFKKKSEDTNDENRLTCLLSTKSGKFDQPKYKNEVPRLKLLGDLGRLTDLKNTDSKPRKLVLEHGIP